MSGWLAVGAAIAIAGALTAHGLKAKLVGNSVCTIMTIAHGLIAGFIAFMICLMSMVGFEWPVQALPDDLPVFLIVGSLGGVLMRTNALEDPWN